jgi:uncharacterized small protein (DUF1192 family)
MPLPENIDGLSPAELKLLVVKLLEEVADLHRRVAALREEIARLKGGPDRLNIKPSRAAWSRRPIQSRRAAPTRDAGAAARERS